MITRTADAHWAGDLKAGKGSIKLGSGAFEGPYSFSSRFEGTKEANPEELLGAAHAGCFSMALANSMAKAGHVVTSVHTTANVTLAKGDAGFSISGILLKTEAKVAGISAAEFQKFAEDTKQNCIVARALASVPTTLDAKLV